MNMSTLQLTENNPEMNFISNEVRTNTQITETNSVQAENQLTENTQQVNTYLFSTGKTQNDVSWEIYCGDALEVTKTLADESFDCVITSPPYFWLRDYGVQGQLGQEDTIGQYVENISLVMDQILRVLKKDGVLFLNLGDTYYSGKGQSRGVDKKSKKRRFGLRAVDKSGGMGMNLQSKTMIGIPWRVALSMIGRGWILRSDIIWYRKASLPESVLDRPKRSYEHIFMFTKSKHYYFDRSALLKEDQEDMWTIVARPEATKDISTAPFPNELVERCLSIGCKPKGKVLDPFSGSGTTIKTAILSGRPSVGIDLSPEFCEYIKTRLSNL